MHKLLQITAFVSCNFAMYSADRHNWRYLIQTHTQAKFFLNVSKTDGIYIAWRRKFRDLDEFHGRWNQRSSWHRESWFYSYWAIWHRFRMHSFRFSFCWWVDWASWAALFWRSGRIRMTLKDRCTTMRYVLEKGKVLRTRLGSDSQQQTRLQRFDDLREIEWSSVLMERLFGRCRWAVIYIFVRRTWWSRNSQTPYSCCCRKNRQSLRSRCGTRRNNYSVYFDYFSIYSSFVLLDHR